MAVSGILVVCDAKEYDSEYNLQIITKARFLANQCCKDVSAICVGNYDEKRLKKLIDYGANTVIIYESAKKIEVNEFADIITEIINQQRPEVIMFSESSYGKASAAILSTRFESGVITDCIDIQFMNDFFFYKEEVNSSFIAKIKCTSCNIKIATIKKDVFVKKQYDETIDGKISKIQLNSKKRTYNDIVEIIESNKIKVKKYVDINKYSIVFCIGRGVSKKQTRDKIFDIAERYGIGVIGTRAAVEAGMIEKAYQVGQSGKNISPQIYIGLGVSGASQHMVGIKNAGITIAINKDENANIFNYSDYSIVEDVDNIISEIEKSLTVFN
ncbi:electron transfer flavoprotein subunit alpha/FixB family protein [Clostridium felsineum]|uniref:Caffeyl-CoA reductase-Etf complex subunit CarE n=1 Tax=Clostridium felsineum TaxID=36839 RepID=A0A1S8MC19_9CLOT|nr:electron transfer flavoprotein subunit alpha/FixB family protein [Clostridium felsineum]MCR3760586.1 electron transfer flavoprotein subunit alpha/FixB family protein [Clostridium felsineum]URZ07875.1 Caffeyl-CoA reductase-Etf complex subunit CarE [Clostridium felsineum]URZ12906.1 Caffeyl-CoA reductase-Etf complex subunit CarE [Clostridium felsineum]URZ15107.1 Caffeyl-CoA reductase-Etf complex subunit CarE [Clostridium felsineum DSM 794]